jgi:ATP-dependent HslUV protease ATP-binding subunit HslU
VIEKLLEEVSFDAGRHASAPVIIDAAFVEGRLASLVGNEDLARYVL